MTAIQNPLLRRANRCEAQSLEQRNRANPQASADLARWTPPVTHPAGARAISSSLAPARPACERRRLDGHASTGSGRPSVTVPDRVSSVVPAVTKPGQPSVVSGPSGSLRAPELGGGRSG